jgi:hypothetical protein
VRPVSGVGAGLIALALAALPAIAGAQQVFKCTTPKGTVTYQETPCPTREEQKRLDTSHGTPAEERAARDLLEREAYRGNRLASEFAEDARERDRREYLERREREERLRREREKEPRSSEEPSDWMPPWGWPGRPGVARPKTKPLP